MAINKSKVAAGGVAAGLVMAVIDIAMSKFFFGARMTAEMNAFKSGLGDQMNVSGWWIGPLVTDLIVGLLLVWTYAAIRPRFGPGQKTAVYAGILFWLMGSLFSLSYGMMGMMSWGLWCMYGIVWLITLIIAALVGGRIYMEDGATT